VLAFELQVLLHHRRVTIKRRGFRHQVQLLPLY
jgi:hypothetical protein